jgi:hypothetical protein
VKFITTFACEGHRQRSDVSPIPNRLCLGKNQRQVCVVADRYCPVTGGAEAVYSSRAL